MPRIIALLLVSASLVACGVVDTMVDGFKHTSAVANNLEQVTGSKPQVGFSWSNGRLTSVTVTFPSLYDAKPLRELANTVRAEITKEFKQTPGTIVLSFSMPGAAPGTTAQLR